MKCHAGKAIHADPNNTIKFAEVGELGIQVQRGPTFDGLGEFYTEMVEESPAEPVDVAQVLRDTRADALVSYLPVGSEDAQRFYAQACLDAGVGFVFSNTFSLVPLVRIPVGYFGRDPSFLIRGSVNFGKAK